ncbi:MAG TPA: hypothetical protein VFK37_10255 [Bacillales bacterium]|nr:hypothetical protein [Bacillales bacterium]
MSKNVLLSKIVKYVFTEDQLRGKWKDLGKNHDFDSLTDDELFDLAQNMLEHANHSELEHHTINSPWRTQKDFEGKVLSENDSDPNLHIELIDTDQNGEKAEIFIDRMLLIKCEDCGFEFFVEDLSMDVSELQCPKDGGKVSISEKAENHIRKK